MEMIDTSEARTNHFEPQSYQGGVCISFRMAKKRESSTSTSEETTKIEFDSDQVTAHADRNLLRKPKLLVTDVSSDENSAPPFEDVLFELQVH